MEPALLGFEAVLKLGLLLLEVEMELELRLLVLELEEGWSRVSMLSSSLERRRYPRSRP